MTIYVGILYIKSTLSKVESARGFVSSAHFVFFIGRGGTGVTLLKNVNFIPLFRINVSLIDARESQLAYSN